MITWDHTDAAKLRELVGKLEIELRKLEPEVGDSKSIESSALSAHEIKGYRTAIVNLRQLSTMGPMLSQDPGFMDFSTKLEGEQNNGQQSST